MAKDRFTIEVAAGIIASVATQMRNLDYITKDENPVQITYVIKDGSGILGEVCCFESYSDDAQIQIYQIIREQPRTLRVDRWHEFVKGVQSQKRWKKQAIANARSQEQPKDTESFESASSRTKSGRPSLDHDDLVYRLAKAQEAEEIRRADQDRYWKEIAIDIGWKLGSSKGGVALLRDARQRLKRLTSDDPLLAEVAEYRAKETKKT